MRSRHSSLEETGNNEPDFKIDVHGFISNPRRNHTLALFLRNDCLFKKQRQVLWELQNHRSNLVFLASKRKLSRDIVIHRGNFSY